jgi:hypothetical protein
MPDWHQQQSEWLHPLSPASPGARGGGGAWQILLATS